jgi:BTB/POZ domain
MSSLLTTGTMSDITFLVRGTEIHAHKAILATASAVLEAMFQPDVLKEGPTKSNQICSQCDRAVQAEKSRKESQTMPRTI